MKLMISALLSAIAVSAFEPRVPSIRGTTLKSHALGGYSPGAPLPSHDSFGASNNRSPAFSGFGHASTDLGPNNSPFKQVQSASASVPPAASRPAFSGFGHAVTASGPNNSLFKEEIDIKESVAAVPAAAVFTGFGHAYGNAQTVSAAAPSAAAKPAESVFSGYKQTCETPADPNPPNFSTQTAAAAAPVAASKPALSGYTQAYETSNNPNPPDFSQFVNTASETGSAAKDSQDFYLDPIYMT
eukprot:CAMPEP_0178912580 /NCGR_PEP_ID=MMETSP0786-20121207/10352_1 /TAXON_ID=186022 /ORGANISM="Thalassionema frauenfeldii, Strain CCMP 1798" /LENGTH=242 /DNA_ID=CAMNT_0020585199 /DNA_START=45 /DNA_END=773 /DNA_ORIENTATION=-